MENIIDSSHGNYSILSEEDIRIKRSDCLPFQVFWKKKLIMPLQNKEQEYVWCSKTLKDNYILIHFGFNLIAKIMNLNMKH
jgi:hypothetical protein